MSCSEPYANHRGLQTTLVYILCSRQPGDDRFTLIKEPFKRQSNYSVDRANAHASAFLQAWSLPACLSRFVCTTNNVTTSGNLSTAAKKWCTQLIARYMAVPDIAELLTMSQAQVMLAASTAYIAPPSKEVC